MNTHQNILCLQLLMTKMSAEIKGTTNISIMYKTFTIIKLPEVSMNLSHISNASVPITLKALIVITCIPPLKTFIPWTKPKSMSQKSTHIKQEIIGIHQWLPLGNKLALKT